MKSGAFLAFAITCAVLQSGDPAHAQAVRTWVSGVGDDANPCSRTAPCKTFAGAISKTAAEGEISVLDPGGFGAVTITKSMSLVADGSEGSILHSGTNGIIINPGATGVVNISGLLLEGAGTTTGLRGIYILSGKSVVIRNCVIRGSKTAPGIGIHIATTTDTSVFISNCTIENSTDGVVAAPTGSGVARVFLDDVKIAKVGNAISAANNGTVRVHKSAITANTTNAITTSGNGKVFSFKTNAIAGNAGAYAASNAILQ